MLKKSWYNGSTEIQSKESQNTDITNLRRTSTQFSRNHGTPPEPPSNNASEAVQGFEALKAVLSTPSRTKYRHRIEETTILKAVQHSPFGRSFTPQWKTGQDSVASVTVGLQGATAERLNVASSSTGATAERSSRVGFVVNCCVYNERNAFYRCADQLLCVCSTRDLNLSHR